MNTDNNWTAENIPDQTGKTAIVTGANSGLGYEATHALALNGAHVVLACRDLAKGQAARDRIQRALPNASLELMELDLASLASVDDFAKALNKRYPSLHILVNNAGVMALPYRQTTDGFEMQFGINHLGHFALTGLLLNPLLNAPGARVVTVSSRFHRWGRLDSDTLRDNQDGKQGYKRFSAYAQSKLANLLFAQELQRRFAACRADAISVAVHPGYAATNLQFTGPRMEGSRLRMGIMVLANRLLAQSAARGALPILYGATSPAVRGGDYIGPDGFMELRGSPQRTSASATSYDPLSAAQLWAVSEDLTGVEHALC